ncbi:hypothetical protein NLI96_g105 [Meripilus lineatus]|uniref:Uncharacterized protein n=1 Tax=Meripilus lineatus TaxID=2056292 RepID=A0AAD5VCZ2_9APHY|nr:hypothetical protein NLI96_g105 [Physisporinus lineatus]
MDNESKNCHPHARYAYSVDSYALRGRSNHRCLEDAAVGRLQSVDLLPFPLPPPPDSFVQKPNNIIDALADELSDSSRTVREPEELVFRKDPESPHDDLESETEMDRRSFDARLPV